MFQQIRGGFGGFPGGGQGQCQHGGGVGGPGHRPPGGGLGAKIHEGIQNGTINRNEADALMSKRQELQQLKQQAMADGQVTPEEQSQLRSYRQQMGQMLSQSSQG